MGSGYPFADVVGLGYRIMSATELLPRLDDGLPAEAHIDHEEQVIWVAGSLPPARRAFVTEQALAQARRERRALRQSRPATMQLS